MDTDSLSVQLHYHLSDDHHAIDARIRRNCEVEALAALTLIADSFGVEVVVETTAYHDGGLREMWDVTLKGPAGFANAMAVITLVVNTFVSVWNAPARSDRQVVEIQKQIAMEDLKGKLLANEKLSREMGHVGSTVVPGSTHAHAQHATEGNGHIPAADLPSQMNEEEAARNVFSVVPANPAMDQFYFHRCNFYRALISYERVTAVGWVLRSADGTMQEEPIAREQFYRLSMPPLLHIDLGKSANPEVEQRILDDIGSYGRQLGRMGDALEVLLNHIKLERLSAAERDSIDDLRLQLAQVKRLKARYG